MFKEQKSTLWWADNTKGWLGRSRDSTFKLRPQLSMQERGHLLEQRLLFEIGQLSYYGRKWLLPSERYILGNPFAGPLYRF